MSYDTVIAVNEQDEEIDFLDKMDAHKKGILHRAISVFIINSKGEWLLQQRAAGKYHSSLLWTNATCTHPMKGETNQEAAKRRLQEEMGLETNLGHLFSFQYKAHLDNDLIEHELDHVFVGVTDGEPKPNVEEVSSYRYISYTALKNEIQNDPSRFTEWFKLIYDRVNKEISV